MENGVLVFNSYNNLYNLGDYIQSLAILQFIEGDVKFINRERLDEYIGDPIKLSMNSWFLHEPVHWPPSNHIEPLFISFHLNSDAYEVLDDAASIDYFKKYQAIGCRDITTRNLLLEKGVNAYFSGCLTLTLGEKYKSKEKTDNIYFVDPYFQINRDVFSIAKYIFMIVTNYRKIRKICKLMFNILSIKSIVKTASFYKYYVKIFDSEVLETAIYLNHLAYDFNITCEIDKFNLAINLLSKYSTAKFVVTSRLHCALPCVGFETPVLYIENINQELSSYCRLDGLRELLHVIKYDNGKMELPFYNLGIQKITLNTIFNNKQDYLVLKEKLILKCRNFFKS